MTAAAHPNCKAVALAKLSAAKVSFQRHQASHPLHKIANSAAFPLLPASHFGGKIAINSIFNAKPELRFRAVG
jgi:hypothetical protein